MGSRQVVELFAACLELAPAARAAYLKQACGGDEELLREVSRLLATDQEIEAGGGSGLVRRLAAGPAATEVMEETLGPYRLVRKLGEGGMSVVYLGAREDGELHRRVAIKVIRPEHTAPRWIRRFEIERQILASLTHPCIASVFDAGRTARGVPYFVMEFIEGEPIDVYCDRRGLNLRERLSLFREICLVVHYAHQNLVVHRDLKPSNILVTADGQPKLLDFGIAKLLNADLAGSPGEPTQVWERLLTPEYASPEHLAGRKITTASDVYSLGALLYKLTTGTLPFEVRGLPAAEAERQVLSVAAEKASSRLLRPVAAEASDAAEEGRGGPVRARARSMRGDVDAILAMALRKEPQHRYASADQFAEDIRRHLAGEPIRARQGTWRYRAGRFVLRHRLGLGVAAVLVLLAGLAGGAFLTQSRRLQEQQQVAQGEQQKAQAVASFLVNLLQGSEAERSRSELITTRALLDSGLSRIEGELVGQEETQAALRQTLGLVYLRLGLYEPARRALTQALEARRQLLAGSDPRLAESLLALAELEGETGRFTASSELRRQALNLLDAGPAAAAPLAAARLGLAADSLNRGEREAAEALARQGLDLLAGDGDGDDALRAEALDLLGQIHWFQGREEAAEQELRRALELRRRGPGPEGEAVAGSLYNLALVLRGRGAEEEAEGYLRQAAALWRTFFGDRHLTRSLVLLNQGSMAAEAGNLPIAESFLRESLEISRSLLSPEHPQTIRPLLALTRVLLLQGRISEAQPLARAAADLCRRTLPEEHPSCRQAAVLEARLAAGAVAAAGITGSEPVVIPASSRAELLTTAMVPKTSGWCVPDGAFDDTLTRYSCCSGRAIPGTTVCTEPEDRGTTWKSCAHVCGSRLVGGCVPAGGVDDTLDATACCSGKSIPGSARCLNPADFATSWRSCVQTCA